MALEPAQLISSLNMSKMQIENNSLYQTILQLINLVKENQEFSAAEIVRLTNQLTFFRTINLIEVFTDTPQVVNLNQRVFGMAIVKDIFGNASGNPIQMIGTVEGVVDPTINTDWGFYKVYRSEVTGSLHTW